MMVENVIDSEFRCKHWPDHCAFVGDRQETGFKAFGVSLRCVCKSDSLD